MANNITDLIAKLKVILDKTSLKNIQKELSKQNLAMKVKIDVDEKASFNSLKSVMKDLSSQLPPARLLEGFVSGLRQSITELKELDTYLTKISNTDFSISTQQLAKIGENSLKNVSSNSGLDGLLSFVDEIKNKMKSLAVDDISKNLFSGIKNFGRPKMSGLVIKYAEYHKCSLGYESFLMINSAIHYGKRSIWLE